MPGGAAGVSAGCAQIAISCTDETTSTPRSTSAIVPERIERGECNQGNVVFVRFLQNGSDH